MLAAYVPILWASHVGTSVAISPLELVRYSLYNPHHKNSMPVKTVTSREYLTSSKGEIATDVPT
jgi:hypothetical protein